MPNSLFWIQGAACGGDSMAMLDVSDPDLLESLELLDISVLWHPSLSNGTPAEHAALVEGLLHGEIPLEYLVVEGAAVRGPGGTGMFDTLRGVPKKNVIAGLAERARYVIAAGTCASFGGVAGAGEVEASGLQFTRGERGGLLGAGFTARGGTPVINLPGCPCLPEVVVGALTALAAGATLELNAYQAPLDWYGMLVHQGCLRNEYHEYRVEEDDFGRPGCLFFHLGCRGPLAHGPCNKLLWSRRTSKTRVGVPCVGCTEPDFPRDHPFFSTRSIAEIPLELPEGVDRAHYLAYKGMAAAAAPDRLSRRDTRI
ncbi:MAG: NADH:ubiquinone oxidoreductase [Armatimonadetes bacterium]|nr:NADH:ubiquinone oxidoreductase [Armatimonadota bacterium]